MKPPRHPLRDAVVLSIPLAVLFLYFLMSSLISFLEAEVINYHGYATRNLRIAGPALFIRKQMEPLWDLQPRRFLPSGGPQARAESSARRFDLRVEEIELDRLRGAIPGSTEIWRPGTLVEDGRAQEVEVRHRGQSFSNFFFESQKTWKIKTKKRELIDGYRIINLTPLVSDRLHDHLAFYLARLIGIPTARTRVVHLYVNQKDQGLYLHEEQIDESMIRRSGRMPGDIFYGETSIPNEPKLGSDGLFWNPFLWRKKARNNMYSEEYRPYLVDLLDSVAADSPESWDRLYSLLDTDEFSRYLAVLSFHGDQHTDQAHNHKLYFNPLLGKFEGIIWNATMRMPEGRGLETMGNPLFRKLCRDPRFLDQVQGHVYREFLQQDISAELVAELDRILADYGQDGLDPVEIRRRVWRLKRLVESRRETLERFYLSAAVHLSSETGESSARARLFARSVGSLRLQAFELDRTADGVRLFADRDFDGRLGPGDRELEVRSEDRRLIVTDPDDLLYVGRDFRAPYLEPEMDGGSVISQYRQYTRLAYLESTYLLVPSAGGAVPEVMGVEATRTLGEGGVEISRGRPAEYVATETIHPWRFPDPGPPDTFRFEGDVVLEKTLVVDERDRLVVEPGTTFRLGAGVSILIHSRTHLDGVRVERLDRDSPWGVVALQGAGTSGSIIENSHFTGGSHDTLNHVYYSGMISIHHADRVVLRDSTFSNNLLGDDTVRIAASRDFEIEGCRFEGANGDAFDSDISFGSISDTEIHQPRNDGIDLMTSVVTVADSVIRGAGDKGISLGEAADSIIRDTEVLDSVIGIAIKDASDPVIERVVVRGCLTGVSSFDKNWRYPGGGQGRLVDCELYDNGLDLVLDEASTLRLENCRVGEEFSPPEVAVREARLQLVDLRPMESPR